MKDKNTASYLALVGGVIGLQHFYLDNRGWGLFNVFLFSLLVFNGPSTFLVVALTFTAIFGVIESISLASMDQEEFDRKYNAPARPKRRKFNPEAKRKNTPNPMNDRERRFRERQRERAERERARVQRVKERYNQRPAPSGPGERHLRRSDPATAARERGIALYKDFDYGGAIEAFREALKKSPSDIASHFNIACAYSGEEEADKAFYHIDRAVALGFDDFGRIRTHDGLAFMRIQPEYPDFEKNNFRLVADRRAEEQELPNPIQLKDTLPLSDRPVGQAGAEGQTDDAAPVDNDLLEQLQRLAILRDKGLLTENEFAAEKRKLLG